MTLVTTNWGANILGIKYDEAFVIYQVQKYNYMYKVKKDQERCRTRYYLKEAHEIITQLFERVQQGNIENPTTPIRRAKKHMIDWKQSESLCKGCSDHAKYAGKTLRDSLLAIQLLNQKNQPSLTINLRIWLSSESSVSAYIYCAQDMEIAD